MGEDEPPDDCMRCGACCLSESPLHARVTGDDHARLGDDAELLVHWVGNAAYMRIENVTAQIRSCIALVIDAATGTFTCSVYETRPQVCRDLERGSGGCRGELASKGERRKRALVVLATRHP